MSLESQLAAITAEYGDRLRRVRAHATMAVVEDASRPRSEGGRMPVDLGNLKNSIRGAVGTVPTGASESPAAAVARARMEDHIFIGWTANYAWVQEIRNGFMRGATTKWSSFVADAIREVRR